MVTKAANSKARTLHILPSDPNTFRSYSICCSPAAVNKKRGPRVHDFIQAASLARRSQKSSMRPLRMQQRRAMMALAPATTT